MSDKRIKSVEQLYAVVLGLDNWEQYLHSGVTAIKLEEQAMKESGNEFAKRMKEARKELFKVIHVPDLSVLDLGDLIAGRINPLRSSFN